MYIPREDACPANLKVKCLCSIQNKHDYLHLKCKGTQMMVCVCLLVERIINVTQQNHFCSGNKWKLPPSTDTDLILLLHSSANGTRFFKNSIKSN